MSVVVNTSERDIDDPNVETVRPDEKHVVIDTIVEDALDQPVDEPPPAKPEAKDAEVQVHEAVKEEPVKVKQIREEKRKTIKVVEKKHHHHTPPPPPRRESPAKEEDVFRALDANPSFARAMRSTLPKNDADAAPGVDSDASSSVSAYSEEEEVIEEQPAKKKKSMEVEKKPKKRVVHEEEEEEQEEAEESESFATSSVGSGSPVASDAEEEGGGDEDEVGSSVSAEEAEEMSKDDEYIEKTKIIEEIKSYAKMGVLPPQPPAFSMPLSLLRKIRDYMSSKADEIMGIGMLGTAWVQVIGVVEKLNGTYDPFAKIFGMGLKLSGAKEAVSEKIHLYEAVFKHIYAKLPKSKEMNPWVQFGLVTVQILAEVHMQNLRREMAEEADRAIRNPRAREEAEEMRRRFEERTRARAEASKVETVETPAYATAQPEAEQVKKEQPRMQPPPDEDDIEGDDEDEEVVDMQQPTPAEEVEIDKKEDGDKEDAEDDDDDDVVIQLPAAKRGSKKTAN